MLQGTGSSVGKSTLVAGLARACLNRGIRVAPFKPQNMSNNAAVVAGGGGEIGRAQALQAQAARIAPTIDMNPVLLKPHSQTGAQVIVHGRVFATVQAREYQAFKPRLLPYVLESFERLRAQYDLILVEGAGSAAETNLRHGDIANMGFARATQTPVIIVGDIDRGGVIASLVGTHAVLDPADAALVTGFIVNRMRGDKSLFDAGMRTIAERTGWAPLGLVPHCDAVRYLPAEDAADLVPLSTGGRVRIAVPLLPGIANFDDLDPLRAEPDLDLRLLARGTPIPGDCALVILPGSKTTIADLAVLREEGWDIDIAAHARRGGHVLGICGGYQMLGRTIADPHGLEGPPGTVAGLGLLDVHTTLTPHKTLQPATGRLVLDDAPFTGYEMHMGQTTGPDCSRPFLIHTDGSPDGATSPDGRTTGTYLHALFTHPATRTTLLTPLGATPLHQPPTVDSALNTLATHLEHHLSLDRLLTSATQIDRTSTAPQTGTA